MVSVSIVLKDRIVVQIHSFPMGKLILFGNVSDIASFKVQQKITFDELLRNMDNKSIGAGLYREVLDEEGNIHACNCLTWPGRSLAFLDDSTAQDLLHQIQVKRAA